MWTLLAALLGLAAAEPLCRFYACPGGYSMRADMLDSTGDQLETCCKEATPGTVDAVVESAGFDDGSEAIFKVDGQILHKTRRRGITVVTLKQAAGSQAVELWEALESAQTFDTHKSSAELIDFLASLPDGRVVLMGVSDEASVQLSEAAKSALRGYGALLTESLGYRSSYALVGRKGGPAWAEELRPRGGGRALAVSPVPAARFADRPICDARVAAPPVAGHMWDGNLVPDAGCRYEVRERGAVARDLAGAWVVVTGASNGLLMFNTLIMLLAPTEADEIRQSRFGGAFVIDAFLEGGKLLRYDVVGMNDPACENVQKALPGDDHASCKARLAEKFRSALAHRITMTRITYFVGFFWAGVGVLTDVVAGDTAWDDADVALVVQISAWYVICNTIKFQGCLRKELMEESEDSVVGRFQSEMTLALSKLDKFCAPGGRAGQRGCVLGTKSWSAAGGALGASFDRFDAEVTAAMATRQSSTFRFLDFYKLGAAMPEETILGHGSQRLQLWAWQVMLGGFASDVATELSASGAGGGSVANRGEYAVFGGTMCSAGQASLDRCPKYKEYCSQFGSHNCPLWQCMNSVACNVFATDKEFAPLPSGADQVCRGKSVTDNLGSYYTAHGGVHTIDDCKSLCIYTPGCTGIEYSASGSRCEVWTTRIGATQPAGGFTCLRYGTTSTAVLVTTLAGRPGRHAATIPPQCTDATTTAAVRCCHDEGIVSSADYGCHAEKTLAEAKEICEASGFRLCSQAEIEDCRTCGTGCGFDGQRIWSSSACGAATTTTTTPSPFVGVDGGLGRACRGKSSADNLPSYYTVQDGVTSLETCQALCRVALFCTGVEFSPGRCELWTTKIGASIAVAGFTCLSYDVFPAAELAAIQTLASTRSQLRLQGRRRRRSLDRWQGIISVQ
eukprot:gb/GFBE01016813.1/.p1 GENE.gb/GFBE01016813.1/~~gb/GFBE01016813.1/.p1  ORF type:complete len:906 (+),score=172.47 gb/GFBE01016813.1/:1-2718(+)